MISLLGIAHYARAALSWPASQYVPAAFDHGPNIHSVTSSGAKPRVIPILMSRWFAGSTRDIPDVGDDPFIVPASRKLGLARLSRSVPMAAAATARLAVEDVRSPLIAHTNVLRRRPVGGIHRIPARTIRPRIANLRRLTVSHAERLVVLLVTTPLGWVRSRGRNVTTRNLPIGPGEIVVRPV
jgi:hypothetical protein